MVRTAGSKPASGTGQDCLTWLSPGRTAARRPTDAAREFCVLHCCSLAVVRDDEVCLRSMTTPGVGPGGGADLSRDCRCARPLSELQSVGAAFGLTCSKYQSGG